MVVLAALVIAPSAGAWTWPVKGPVLQKFVLGDDPYAAGQHRGIDIGAAAGEPVLAPASGTVSFAGTVPLSGRTVTIRTPDGYSVTLTHLASTGVRRGETVGEGAAVGTIGPSGEVEHDVPYVHLGIRKSEDPNGYVDPLLFLPVPVEPTAAPTSAPPVTPAPSPPPASPAPAAKDASPVASAPAASEAPLAGAQPRSADSREPSRRAASPLGRQTRAVTPARLAVPAAALVSRTRRPTVTHEQLAPPARVGV